MQWEGTFCNQKARMDGNAGVWWRKYRWSLGLEKFRRLSIYLVIQSPLQGAEPASRTRRAGRRRKAGATHFHPRIYAEADLRFGGLGAGVRSLARVQARWISARKAWEMVSEVRSPRATRLT
jgi:hypothetical protein